MKPYPFDIIIIYTHSHKLLLSNQTDQAITPISLTTSSYPSLYSSVLLASSAFFLEPPGTIITQEVGRLVAPAEPRSSFDGMKTYGTLESSHNTGKWEMTSPGEISPAMTTAPFSPFLRAFTTSLTPRRTCFAFDAVDSRMI